MTPAEANQPPNALETLQEYNFDVEYCPGARNYIQDTLSRLPDYKKPVTPNNYVHNPAYLAANIYTNVHGKEPRTSPTITRDHQIRKVTIAEQGDS